MSRATLGPWKVRVNTVYVNCSIIGKGGQHVAEVWSGNARSLAVAEANARLIAQAPALVAALRALMAAEGGEAGDSKAQRSAWRQAQAALKKAEA